MLVLSIRTPRRIHSGTGPADRVHIVLPSGEVGTIIFFYCSGKRSRVGFDFPLDVRIVRGDVVDGRPNSFTPIEESLPDVTG